MSLKFHFRAVYVLHPLNKGTIINADKPVTYKAIPKAPIHFGHRNNFGVEEESRMGDIINRNEMPFSQSAMRMCVNF